MSNHVKKWSDLSIKDKIGYIISISAFIVGTILVFIGMILPPMGIIDNSVLMALGEFFTLSAVFLGINVYFGGVKNDIKKIISDFQDKNSEEKSC